MNNELLLLIKKHTDMLNEQTKTKPQETLEIIMNKQMESFSISPALNLGDEDWLLTVTSFEATNFDFNITDENISFSITILGHWNSKSTEKLIDELNILLGLKSQNDIDLHVEQVAKKGLIL